MALNVSLPQELEKMVHKKVSTGLYQSASEVVRKALHDFFTRPSEHEVLAFFAEERLKEIEKHGERWVVYDEAEIIAIEEQILQEETHSIASIDVGHKKIPKSNTVIDCIEITSHF